MTQGGESSGTGQFGLFGAGKGKSPAAKASPFGASNPNTTGVPSGNMPFNGGQQGAPFSPGTAANAKPLPQELEELRNNLVAFCRQSSADFMSLVNQLNSLEDHIKQTVGQNNQPYPGPQEGCWDIPEGVLRQIIAGYTRDYGMPGPAMYEGDGYPSDFVGPRGRPYVPPATLSFREYLLSRDKDNRRRERKQKKSKRPPSYVFPHNEDTTWVTAWDDELDGYVPYRQDHRPDFGYY